MRSSKIIVATSLILPLLVIGCNREEQSPTATAPSQEKQAMAPSSRDKMLESAPPAAGTPPSTSGEQSTPSGAQSTPATPSPGDTPANQSSEPKKSGY